MPQAQERNKVLCEAYGKLFGREPSPEKTDWDVAALVIEGLDPRVLGEGLAKDSIFQVFNHLAPPKDFDITGWSRRVVIREMAECTGRELFWPNLPQDVDSNYMEWLERKEHWLASSV